MHDLLRQEVAATADLVVVKVGSRVLTGDDGLLNHARVASLSEELHDVLTGGRKVVLVSSGAVAAGMGQLKLRSRPTDLAHLQAVAAVGQAHLVQAYDQSLRKHGRHAAQLLLTADDLDHRARYLNVRNTILTLLEYGAVPIINENDTVAVDELLTTFGDNDRLAAMVANLIRAPLLILLSDVDGLFDGDPADAASKIVSTVTSLDPSVTGLVREKGPGLGKGGMASKLEAARLVTTAGENCVIAGGRTPGNLGRILAGESIGTLFVPRGQAVTSRKRWIGLTVQPRGRLTLDAGACRALVEQGRSLLAIGIAAVEGQFAKGDVVALCDASGIEIARGLTNYAAAEVDKIKGLKSDAIAAALSHCPYQEVIHRDNMTLTGK